MKTDIPEGYEFSHLINFELDTAVVVYRNTYMKTYRIRRTYKEIIQEIGISKFTAVLRREISCATTLDELRLASALKHKYIQYLI